MYVSPLSQYTILASGSWDMNESLHWSPWRNLKHLAGIQKLEIEWVKGKIDPSCSFLPPFVAALKPELSCFDIEKFRKSWRMPSKIHQARSRSPPRPMQTQTVCSGTQSTAKSKAGCSLLELSSFMSSQSIQLSEHLAPAAEILLSPEGEILFCSGMALHGENYKLQNWMNFPIVGFVRLGVAEVTQNSKKEGTDLTEGDHPWSPPLRHWRAAVSLGERRLCPEPQRVWEFNKAEMGL